MFNIENSSDKLALLQSDFERLKQNPLDISLAEKACLDAWHLGDWVFKEMTQEITIKAFRTNLYLECPEMRVLHDLANTFKHKELSDPKVKIRKAIVHPGGLSMGFSKGYNVPRLEVSYNEVPRIDVDDLVKLAIEYWKKKLKVL